MPRDKEPAGFIGKPDQHSAAIARIGTQVGWLEKQSDFAKKWNRRFCVLRPCTLLYYYENEGDDKPKGVIDLENYHFVQSCGDDDRPHSFTVGAIPFAKRGRASPLRLLAFHADCWGCVVGSGPGVATILLQPTQRRRGDSLDDGAAQRPL